MLEWKALWADMKEKCHSPEWSPTTQNMFDEMLGVVPPAGYFSNGFLMGEESNHTTSGEAVYSAFRNNNGNYEAKYVTKSQIKAMQQAKLQPVGIPKSIIRWSDD